MERKLDRRKITANALSSITISYYTHTHSALFLSNRDPVTLGLVAPRHPECQGQRYGLEEGEEEEEEEGEDGGGNVQLDRSLYPVVAKDLQHLEPIAPCLTTAAGDLAVDFVVRCGKGLICVMMTPEDPVLW